MAGATHSSRTVHALCLVCLALAVLAACGPTPVVTRTPVTFEMAVSSGTQPLVADLAAAYRTTHPYITFRTRPLNSAQAMTALREGEVDLAAVSWLTDTESVWLTPVAIDGLAIVVHPSNPVKNFTLLQLRDVFRGRTAAWPEAGGPPGDITVISRENGSGARAEFESAVMEGRGVTVNARVLPSDEAVLQVVSTITTAVGYISAGYATGAVQIVSVEGVPPTLAAISERRYPLTQPLLFVTPEEPQGELRDFVAWVLSPEGQKIVGNKYGRVK